ncbi:MAG: GntR family transcriptional regulator [Anaerolineae bacterium]|nr:GntR family transcriptional regulator [Anaerolineae bacterium]
MHLKRESPTPLYIQLKNTLVAQISTGTYESHQQLPSERELCERYNVSRTTVRQAITELIYEGAVYARPGKGTFVSEPKINQQLKTLTGFSQDVVERGGVPTSHVLKAELLAADPGLAEVLQITPDAEVVMLSRLRLANDVPLAIETTYLYHALCPGVLEHDFAIESLYRVLGRDYGLRLVRAEQTIEAGLANIEELNLLSLVSPAPVLKMERLTYTDQDILVEYTMSIYRSDRYKFRTTLSIVQA